MLQWVGFKLDNELGLVCSLFLRGSTTASLVSVFQGPNEMGREEETVLLSLGAPHRQAIRRAVSIPFSCSFLLEEEGIGLYQVDA